MTCRDFSNSTSSASLVRTLLQIRPFKASSASAGEPSKSTSPLLMIAMREQSSRTSSTMCVDKITVTLLAMELSRFRNRFRSAGSSAATNVDFDDVVHRRKRRPRLALTITGLSKTYSIGVQALRNLSLTIGNGMYGLLGPNGAGKSTLMRTVATLQDPDS